MSRYTNKILHQDISRYFKKQEERRKQRTIINEWKSYFATKNNNKTFSLPCDSSSVLLYQKKQFIKENLVLPWKLEWTVFYWRKLSNKDILFHLYFYEKMLMYTFIRQYDHHCIVPVCCHINYGVIILFIYVMFTCVLPTAIFSTYIIISDELKSHLINPIIYLGFTKLQKCIYSIRRSISRPDIRQGGS